MPTQIYRLKDGTRVPSVTTVLGRFKESGPLMHWAWEMGRDGKDYRKERDNAASAGNLAHAAIEQWKHKEPPKWEGEPEVVERAKRAFGAFLEWAEQTKLTIDQTELPLVSEQHKFGGCFDAILIQNRRALGDWKTSGGVYGEYLAQLGAYGVLWEENFPDKPLDGGFHLLRFDKHYGDFSHRFWAELDAGKRFFLHLLAAYREDKELKERAK